MLSDETIAEIRALDEARRGEYAAEQEREGTIRALSRQIRQHSPCDQWQSRALAEHLVDIGWMLPDADEADG